MMKKITLLRRSLLLIGLLLFLVQAKAGNPADYEQRREAFIQTALNNFNGDAITLQAYKGLPVDQNEINNLLSTIPTNAEADFRMVKLIRVLFFTNGEYEAQILPVLRSIPLWMEPNEEFRQYWSENHMIMWSSSAYLLKQKYGWETDSSVEKRVKQFLQLKVNYGFYEFFSSTYAPYCLSGILNLADFAEDPEIKDLAIKAAQRLLKEFLLMANDQGTYFPAAGRNYYEKYGTPYRQNHTNIIYLLTGFGQVPGGGSHASNFLASSSVPLDDVIPSWKSELDTLYKIGHTLQQGFALNSQMSPLDKVLLQWSSGAYFHPDVATETFQLIKDYNLWGHEEFEPFEPFSFLPTALAPTFANIASSITKSSVICGQDVYIFKNRSVTLSSIQDFWKGKVGYQAFPCVANLGTTAVLTASGEVTGWDNRPSRTSNTSLPYVQQKQNVALLMYRPEKTLPLFGHRIFDVSLHFIDNDFDEVRENERWLLGRQGDSYIAVRRACTEKINGFWACDNPDGQTWVFVVGNAAMHGSFDDFYQVISQSQFEERWYFNLPTLQWVYYSKIVVDGKTIEYAWNGDILSGPTQPTGLFNNPNKTIALNLYPNPATTELRVDLSAFRGQEASIRIHNLLGQEMYSVPANRIAGETLSIRTDNWSNGTYVISVEGDTEQGTGKFIVRH